MRAGLVLLLQVILIYFLQHPIGKIPPLGKFLNPFTGCWQQASHEVPHEEKIWFQGLNDTVTVSFDARMVPHIFAQQATDAITVQGYLHARYRLWQMDMTTRLAGGHLSEVAGAATIDIDRKMRRLGMVFAAEQSTKSMLADSQTHHILMSYCLGVNYFIHQLHYKEYPLEYKLMDFSPEDWTPLKTGLMLKFMADKLSGRTQDFELTLIKQLIGEDVNALFPLHLIEEYPVIGLPTHISQTTDTSTALHPNLNVNATTIPMEDKGDGIGSNNWAIDGSKSQSGYPILCNDPHLPFNLPAIWYENQLCTPNYNCYGVSLPGAPQIVIGFNDSISWGFTNGYRDVKDFFEVTYTDNSHTKIQRNQGEELLQKRIEIIKVKNASDQIDTVYYSSLGPIMYDASYPKSGFLSKSFIVRWMGHEATNELKALVDLNQSQNYNQFQQAIFHFQCPHQNMVYADVAGNIAMWSQGQFEFQQAEQGRFVEDATTFTIPSQIPVSNNPHELNPSKHYVMSANQINTSRDYAFAYHGIFSEDRAKRLTHLLQQDSLFSLRSMMQMQLDPYWQNAADLLPWLLSQLPASMTKSQNTALALLKNWDYKATAECKAATLYSIWFDELQHSLYDDEFGTQLSNVEYPNPRVTIQWLKSNVSFRFYDNVNTPLIETKRDIIWQSFQAMVLQVNSQPDTRWYIYKNSTAQHLGKIDAFSVSAIHTDGGKGMVNAAGSKEGPSWRMIVHMKPGIEAYGIYPGGQDGNPGSPFYVNMISDWSKGSYYQLNFAHSPSDVNTTLPFIQINP